MRSFNSKDSKYKFILIPPFHLPDENEFTVPGYSVPKDKSREERLLNADSLFTSANGFITELTNYLIEKEFTFEGIRKPELREKQLDTLRRNYLNLENQEAGKTKYITNILCNVKCTSLGKLFCCWHF